MNGAKCLILIGCLLHEARGTQWAVWMPQSIEALSGSCVLIPCTYDFPSIHEKDMTPMAKGLWKRGGPMGDTVFDSSKTNEENGIAGILIGHVHLKNCTTVLDNFPSSYSDSYFFRVENPSGPLDFNLIPGVQINAQETAPKPSLTPVEVEVTEGTSVSLTCSAAAPCPKLPPDLTWTPSLGDSLEQLQENEDQTKIVSSILNFTASHRHNEQKITCRAFYTLQQGDTQKMSEASLTLKVQYMPQISGSGSCNRTAAQISCSCETHGNPSPSMEWHVSGLRVTNSTDRVVREERLGNTSLRSSLTMNLSQEVTPTVLCLSTNTVGSSSLQLHVLSLQSGFPNTALRTSHATPPRPFSRSATGTGFQCTPLLYVIIAALICLNVLTIGFCIQKNKRVSKKLKGGRDRETYASLQLSNISPVYDELQMSKQETLETVNAEEDTNDHQH